MPSEMKFWFSATQSFMGISAKSLTRVLTFDTKKAAKIARKGLKKNPRYTKVSRIKSV